ncbi:uncharacterized protein LOC116301864 [Actinia tenebrosa]|uniref:Uncharacterized protein LOC116301864 n=1 Tax=Actinia tenebrosa TaxID=6105 RepID=A0A6P8IKC7_ACTTE|nr:uncharacterized protein LOC116301864 [Actinia tenebrosa]
MEPEEEPNFEFNLADSLADEYLVLEAEKIEEDVKNSSRFASCEEKDLNELVSSANAKGTKRNTKWVLKLLQEYCHERKICKPLLDLTEAELNDILRRFYAEARNKKGEEYSRSSLLGFRNAVERHFAVNGKAMKLTNNPAFYSSNKILESKLKVNKREQKQNTKHKPVIEPADVSKVKKNPFLSHENPYGLLRRVWFIVTLYCQRPVPIFTPEDPVWYENKPLGVNKLGDMMKSISIGAGLSKVYTNHSVRATAITMWSNAGIPTRHIMSISGHTNEQSILSYNRRPSVQQLKTCSDVISSALTDSEGESRRLDRDPRAVSSTSTSVQVVQSEMAINSIPESIFNGCSIQNVNVYVVKRN